MHFSHDYIALLCKSKNMYKRPESGKIAEDLESKIVLLSGPRQVGKTTLSKSLFPSMEYLNFDDSEHRKVIRARSWRRDVDLIVFDELHKMPKWKSWIKGIYDTEGVRPRILVTGSARLDVFRKGGDSLAGRHFTHRLLPFSPAELNGQMNPRECLDRILAVGGFPEPFTVGTPDFAKRWRSTHLDRILKEDLLELEPVRSIKQIEILVDLLADRVGNTISMASIARDLEVSPHSVKKWIGILESLYVVFVVPPYSKNLARALLKEPKIYFHDTGRVTGGEGPRFENAVACALLKHQLRRQDLFGMRTRLHYVRDKEKREVDFLLEEEGKITLLLEAKLSDSALSPHLAYFKKRLKPKSSVQLVHNLKRNEDKGGVLVRKAAEWLAGIK